jgi:hypothetical protein
MSRCKRWSYFVETQDVFTRELDTCKRPTTPQTYNEGNESKVLILARLDGLNGE